MSVSQQVLRISLVTLKKNGDEPLSDMNLILTT